MTRLPAPVALLRRFRLEAALTQEELARRAGISVRALRDLEHGRVRSPQLRSVQRLAAALELGPADRDLLWASFTARPPASDAGALHIGILGPLSLRRGDDPVELRAPRQRDLLGLMALQPGQPVSREEIIDVLWGDEPPPTCSTLVHVNIARLRTLLEPQRARGAPARMVVTLPGRGYRLDLTDDHLDLARFDGLAARGRRAQAGGDLEPACDLLAEALRCWRGPLLADADVRLRRHPAAVAACRRRVAAALAYADIAVGLGRHEEAVEPLRALAQEEPLHEGLCARLMLTLAACGEHAAALRLFEGMRERLAEELGVDPGMELQAAHVRVLRHQLPAAARPKRTGTEAEGTGTAPTFAGGGGRPAQLPADVATFTGRAAQLRWLDAQLAEADAAERGRRTGVVITAITGAPGVGKSALAIHAAHRLADRFPDGQLYVNLHGYATSPLQVLARMLRSLGVEAEKIPVEVEEASALFRSLLAGTCMLVVLDNASSAEQARPLLPGTPGCAVLITSRDRLTGLVAIDGAHRLSLDVLSAEEAVSLLARVLGHDRAAAEPQAIAELARVCAYLPLALRIAAANLICQPDQSVAGYVAALRAGDRLTALEVGGDKRAAVRVAFDQSYWWLAPEAQRLFRLVGLMPGPTITAPAAAALASISSELAGQLLDQLAGAHLLEQAAPGRFAFHDLLRLYARERAEQHEDEPERQSAISRLLGWYLHGADAAVGLLYPGVMRLPVPAADPWLPPAGFDDHAGALAWLNAEWDNLVAGITGAAEHGQRQHAWLLADALRMFFWIHRNTVDWLAVATAGLTAARHDGDLRAQVAAELSLGDAHQCTGRYPKAIGNYSTAFDLAREAGWVEAQAAVLNNLGLVHGSMGNLDQAIEHYARALELYRRIGQRKGEANALGNLGNLHWERGALQQAAEFHSRALTLERQIGSRGGEALSLGGLGEATNALGRVDQAVEYLTRALALHREIGDRYGEAYGLAALAAVHSDAGRAAHALDLAHAALLLAHAIGERRAEAEARHSLGSVQLQLGCPAQALDHYRQALGLARETGTTYAETRALLGLAAAHRQACQHARALDRALEALALAGKVGYRMLEGQASTTLAAVQLDLGDHDKAIEHARQALTTHRQTGYRLGRAHTLVVLGHALRQQDAEAALSCWRDALALFAELGSPDADQLRAFVDP